MYMAIFYAVLFYKLLYLVLTNAMVIEGIKNQLL